MISCLLYKQGKRLCFINAQSKKGPLGIAMDGF